MANINKPNLLFFIFFSLIWAAQIIQGSRIRTINPNPQPVRVYHHSGKQDLQGSSKGFGESIKMKGRRMMIGSVAPTCTYNECRGCKFRCKAQQVPVEENDPINSSYRYKCICHKY